MDWWLASFFIGAILSLFLPIVPDLFLLFLLLLLSISFFHSSLNLSKPLRLGSGLLFGAIWMLFIAADFQSLWHENKLNVKELSANKHWLQGQVSSLHALQKPLDIHTGKADKAKSADKRLRFNFRVTHFNQQKLTTPVLLRLSWNNASLFLQQGQTALLKVKFKPAHGLANVGSFSYQTWLNSKNISGTGYVINHKDNQLLVAQRTVRQQLFSQYKNLLPDHELAPLLLALGFGSRSELTKDLWQVLQATGTGHLIAISGLHIGLVATGSYFFIMLLIRILPLNFLLKSQQFQTMNIRYVAIGLSMMVALSYGYLAGFSLPTIRALLMLSLYWCTRLLTIKISVKRWLLITLFLLTLTTPFSLFSASFWLSIYAVTIIFLTLWRFKNFISTGRKSWRFIKGLIVIQLSLTLLLLPVSALFFQQITVLALFANIIAVPWMSFLSIPLCLLSVLLMPISETLSQFCIWLCLESVQAIWHYLHYLSAQSWALIELTNADVQLLVIVGVLSIGLLSFQPRFMINYRIITVLVCCLAILFGAWQLDRQASAKSVNDSKNWQLVVFDVGQGLSILIKSQGKAILYDTGASYASGFNMIDAVVLPYLQHVGIKSLDKVIISHSDNDHAGGLAILQQSIDINELVYNANSNESSGICQQGRSFYWQGLTFEMLWPESRVAKENDDSCVLLITDGKHKVLLTGDISKKVEAELIRKYPQLQADILVVPHHGSKTSSSAEFIAQLNPKIAIVSAGFLNRWGMPVAEVVKRYQQHNVPLFNSAESGQVIIKFSKKGMVKQTYHDDLWPFWFAN
ncbi:DNA internalization-related competence protein ComEC/Rec2 [Colwellia sp. 39_35_sub15_T18]|nr:DNA internalization-related competence protein ComEC/Rec2 [Colwellia sp. 39_35_sub15_T18]